MVSTESGNDLPIILLDLNYTLVENSKEAVSIGRCRDFELERYRQWLVDTLLPFKVILITARPARQKDETLRNISQKTGWSPDEAYFSEWGYRAPKTKQTVLETYVFPVHGRPDDGTRFLAIESNDETAAMYRSYGIGRLRAEDVQSHPELLIQS